MAGKDNKSKLIYHVWDKDNNEYDIPDEVVQQRGMDNFAKDFEGGYITMFDDKKQKVDVPIEDVGEYRKQGYIWYDTSGNATPINEVGKKTSPSSQGKETSQYPQEVLDAYNSPDNKPGNFKDLAQLNDEYQRGELKKPGFISQALGMIPKVDAGNIGREQKVMSEVSVSRRHRSPSARSALPLTCTPSFSGSRYRSSRKARKTFWQKDLFRGKF